MINHLSIQVALRTRLATLAVCTTGSTSLSATVAGYARAAGSFIVDGFQNGMEITPSGFTTNTVDTIIGVTALALTTRSARAVEASASGRTIAVTAPATTAWENMHINPSAATPYIEEVYLPGGMTQLSLGTLATLEALPIYRPNMYVPAAMGFAAAAAYCDAILTLFAPGTEMITTTGDRVVVRRDLAPSRGQLLHDPTGFAVVQVTIPLRVRTTNSI